MTTEALGTAQLREDESGGLRTSLSRAALQLQSDERLVELCRSGCDRAFEVLDERYRPQLVRYCTPMLGADRAQDVAQQTLTKAYETLRSDDEPPAKLRYWMLRVAHNYGIDVLRKKSSTYEELNENFDGVPQPAAVIEQRQRIGSVFAEIDSLPDRQRAALLLREFEGRSYDEIAAELDATPAVVSQLLQRARTRLRNALGLLIPVPVLRALLSAPGSGGGSRASLAEVINHAAASSPGLVQAGAVALTAGVITFSGSTAIQQSQAQTVAPGQRAALVAATDDPSGQPAAGTSMARAEVGGADAAGGRDHTTVLANGGHQQSGSQGGARHGLIPVIARAPRVNDPKHMTSVNVHREPAVTTPTMTARQLKDARRQAAYQEKLRRQREHRTEKKQRQTKHDDYRRQRQSERLATRREMDALQREQKQQQKAAKHERQQVNRQQTTERKQAAQQQKQANQQQKQAAQQERRQAAEQQRQAAEQQRQAAQQQKQAIKQQKQAVKQQKRSGTSAPSATTVAP